MLRLRRYRVFLVFAIIATLGVYHFSSGRNWQNASNISVDSLRKFGQKEVPTTSTTAIAQEQKTAPAPLLPSSSAQNIKPIEGIAPTKVPSSQTAIDPATSVSTSIAPIKSVQQEYIPVPEPEDEEIGEGGQGRLEAEPTASLPRDKWPHWRRLPEHFPVPSKDIIALPTGSPNSIPAIQHAFTDESSNSKIERERKRAAVKDAFVHAWNGYTDRAWMHDELRPVTGGSRDPFAGWAATLVDSLDTLWMMGMKAEFEEATNAVNDIDFTTLNRKDIPLFETTIRYLGGLLAAHDLSEGKYKVHLDKAVELADVLMGAFDTPNRMPMTFYHWAPDYASQPHRADTRVVLAEIGSLSVEFTRLAQITKEDKYYDAIARITNEFEKWQMNTKLPGMWPIQVDASGCKKPEGSLTPLEHSLHNGEQDPLPPIPHAKVPSNSVDEGSSTPKSNPAGSNDVSSPSAGQGIADPHAGKIQDGRVSPDAGSAKAIEADARSRGGNMGKIQGWGAEPDADVKKAQEAKAAKAAAAAPVARDVEKRQSNDKNSPESFPPKVGGIPPLSAKTGKGIDGDVDCEAQGLASPPKSQFESFTLGGMSDSIYEYLPKEYMLLGGLNDQYRTMYEKAMDTVRKYLLFRPMVTNNRNILFAGQIKTSGHLDLADDVSLKPEGQHLTCFAGGMFAVGAKIWGIKGDLEIAAKLTDACIWAYEITPTGIMPEGFDVVPCDDMNSCAWNETKWHEELDPYRELRRTSTHGGLKSAAEDGTAAKDTSEKSGDPLSKRQLGEMTPSQDNANTPASGDSTPTGGFTSSAPDHEEFVRVRIKEERLPDGITTMWSRKYILRYGN